MLVILVLAMACQAQEKEAEKIPEAVQIATAVLPLQENLRAGATVYGYTEKGTLKTLRKGTNDMICIADNPSGEGVSVSCYPSSLEPFMARGRELSAEGKSFKEKARIRGEEIASGKIKMPEDPTMLSICFGEAYNQETGEISDAKLRYVVYTPFATSKSTGMPDTPQPGGQPWLMDAGTHRAHIMIGPFKKQ